MTAEGVMTMESAGKKNKWQWRITAFLVAGMATGAGIGFAVGKLIKQAQPCSVLHRVCRPVSLDCE
jgi:uncharacterized membrane protein YfcA